MFRLEATQPLLCPRCTAAIAADDRACRRCGQRIVLGADGRPRADGTACPRCSRAARPGEAFVTLSGGEADACPHCGSALEAVPVASPARAFEERAVACPPFDLEQVARAEAVDGWALWDTTVDARRPGMILAHFRRPARPGASPEAWRTTSGPGADRRAGGPIRPDPRVAAPYAMGGPAAGNAPSTAPRSSGTTAGAPRARSSTTAHPGPGGVRPGVGRTHRLLMPHAIASAATRPLWERWRELPPRSLGEILLAVVCLAIAGGLYAAVFAIVATAVLLAWLFRGAGVLALVIVLPAVLALVVRAARAGAARSRGKRVRIRHRHVGQAWHRG